jgi:hypothetical protein
VSLKRVFPDTGVLLAMIVFPRDRSGSTTLAGEVLELVTTQAVIASPSMPQGKLREAIPKPQGGDCFVAKNTPRNDTG